MPWCSHCYPGSKACRSHRRPVGHNFLKTSLCWMMIGNINIPGDMTTPRTQQHLVKLLKCLLVASLSSLVGFGDTTARRLGPIGGSLLQEAHANSQKARHAPQLPFMNLQSALHSRWPLGIPWQSCSANRTLRAKIRNSWKLKPWRGAKLRRPSASGMVYPGWMEVELSWTFLTFRNP